LPEQFLDTDAVVHEHSFPFHMMFQTGKELIFSPDIPEWGADFCAGVRPPSSLSVDIPNPRRRVLP
jgi:hypothetical protein